MRELKFRGYNEHLGEWVYGGAYLDGHILTGIVESNDEYIIIEEWRPVSKDSVGQNTGLIDESGREIYEGDYVIAIDEHTGREFTGKIVYSIGSFAIQNYYSTNFRLLDYKMKVTNESSLDFYYKMRQDDDLGGQYINS